MVNRLVKILPLEHSVKDQEENDVGFEMVGTNVDEAQNIPADEKKALLEAFGTYISSFNEVREIYDCNC